MGVGERPTDVTEREVGVELGDLVGVVAAVFVRTRHVHDPDAGPVDGGCTVAVLRVPNDAHTHTSNGDGDTSRGPAAH